MVDKTITKEAFEASRQEIISGSLKFSENYVSTFELFKAVSKWVEDDERVMKAILRSGGDQHAVDFQYNLDGLKPKERNALRHTRFTPFFKEYFGDDHMIGWDYAHDIFVIK